MFYQAHSVWLIWLSFVSAQIWISFSDFLISSSNGTRVEPKYLIKKPVFRLVIPTSPNLPLMGDMGSLDELKRVARVDWCGTWIRLKGIALKWCDYIGSTSREQGVTWTQKVVPENMYQKRKSGNLRNEWYQRITEDRSDWWKRGGTPSWPIGFQPELPLKVLVWLTLDYLGT